MNIKQIIDIGNYLVKFPITEKRINTRYEELIAKGYAPEIINDMVLFELGFSAIATLIISGEIAPYAIETGSLAGFEAGLAVGPQGAIIGGLIGSLTAVGTSAILINIASIDITKTISESIFSSEYSEETNIDLTKIPTMLIQHPQNNIKQTYITALAAAPKRHDPLLVDLDSDGIETTKVANGVYFDHKNDGFAEKSAWVGQDDGILVVDRNNNGIIDNGTELLGDQFVLSDGTKATSGFAALSSFDSNEDLVIDENDELFNQIKVLKGDGTLLTLEQAGISSISLTTTTSNTKDSNGNTKLKIGSYTTTDGQTREAADYIFQSDLVNSIATNIIEVPEDIEILPDAIGFGVVDTLHQAMAKDSSGSLKTLVQSFINENNISQKQNILTNIIYKWAEVENINYKMFLAA